MRTKTRAPRAPPRMRPKANASHGGWPARAFVRGARRSAGSSGRVSVDGEKLTTPAFLVTESSRIVVDGKPLPQAERTRLWRYHKPAGLMTTHRDPQNRTTLFERLPADMPRVVSVGRLDINSEGLLLLTNDGALARRLELPANGWQRRYRVRVHGKPEPEKLVALER